MQVNNHNTTTSSIANSAAVQKVVKQPIQKEISADASRVPAQDRVEISGMSNLLKTLKAGGDFRADKVADVKSQIEAGTYETDDKLDAAADKMLDDLLK